MVLVDTNVWVEFFRGSKKSLALSDSIESGEVYLHPFVLTELVLGGLKKELQLKMESFVNVSILSENQLRKFITEEKLFGRGLGFVDIHLLSASRIYQCDIWTYDSYLKKAAVHLGIRAI